MRYGDFRMGMNITQGKGWNNRRLEGPREDNSPGKRKPWSTGTGVWDNKLMSLLKPGTCDGN